MRPRGSPMRPARALTSRRASATWLGSVTAVNTLGPTRQSDDGALTRRGADFKLVGKAFGAAETEAQPATAGVAILHCQREVSDAWPLVGKGQAHAATPAVGDHFDTQRAAAAVIERIATDLARRSDKLGLLHQAEAGGNSARPDGLAHPHHVI